MGVRRVPEAGTGSAETVRVSTRGTAGREENRVGSGDGVDGGMSQIADDRGEYRTAREILCGVLVGIEGSDGA